MIYKYYIWFVPGAKGSISIFQHNTVSDELKIAHLDKLPTYECWKYTVINLAELSAIIATVSSGTPFTNIKCLIEQVTSYGQGKKSAFGFGANSLGLVNFLHAIGLQVCSIPASTWKRGMLLDSDKRKSVALALQLFPELQTKKGLSHDESEALLLAFINYKSENSGDSKKPI